MREQQPVSRVSLALTVENVRSLCRGEGRKCAGDWEESSRGFYTQTPPRLCESGSSVHCNHNRLQGGGNHKVCSVGVVQGSFNHRTVSKSGFLWYLLLHSSWNWFLNNFLMSTLAQCFIISNYLFHHFLLVLIILTMSLCICLVIKSLSFCFWPHLTVLYKYSLISICQLFSFQDFNLFRIDT